MYRHLSQKCPKIVSDVIEDETTIVDGEEIPGSDYSAPNPNGELDNLYLDMNGIVHPCTHPEGEEAPPSEDEMLLAVFKYTERVLNVCRPRKVLMMAIDGVAPRAKMNQQRARRFRSAKDAAIEAESSLTQQLKDKTVELQTSGEKGKSLEAILDEFKQGLLTKPGKWDSNAITPGTPFMEKLAAALRYWVGYKLNTEPGWRDLKVIISDATVPGEGEHKIMEFIRSQRGDVSYSANTSHCIYGLDADLIFLGLATHEPKFKLLREDVFRQNKTAGNQKKPFIWLNIDILREYLREDLRFTNPATSIPFDLERAIDDWVFLCFFVGNDFLPHLPACDVRDGSINVLVNNWKHGMSKWKDYITCDGHVNLDQAQDLLKEFAKQEQRILVHQEQDRVEYEKSQAQKNARQQAHKDSKKLREQGEMNAMESMPLYDVKGESVGDVQLTNRELVGQRNEITLANLANQDAADKLRFMLKRGNDQPDESDAKRAKTEAKPEQSDAKPEQSDSAPDQSNSNGDAVVHNTGYVDNVQFSKSGYASRYYMNKFHAKSDEIDTIRHTVAAEYIRGVCWVLMYYYHGCQSWSWFYPYHYAPLAGDFDQIADMKVDFGPSEPFRPYEQLMSVLPAASGHNLPAVFRPLMSDADSPIVEYYPENFQLDLNGKKQEWKAVVLLPFINAEHLLEHVQKKYSELTPEEKDRNTLREEIVIFHRNSKFAKTLEKRGLMEKGQVVSKKSFELGSSETQGLAGTVEKQDENDQYTASAHLTFPLSVSSDKSMPSFEAHNNNAVTLEYKIPVLKHENKSMLLQGYVPPKYTLSDEEREAIRNRERQRRGPQTDSRLFSNTDSRQQNELLMRGSYLAFKKLSLRDQPPPAREDWILNNPKMGGGQNNNNRGRGGFRGRGRGQGQGRGGYQGYQGQGYGGGGGGYGGGGYGGHGGYGGGHRGGHRGGRGGRGGWQ